MPARIYTSSDLEYKFGFNGEYKDEEVKGCGVQYDYGFRIFDSRIAKFLSVDPLTDSYPMFTPYKLASNTPIQAIDLDGLELLDYRSSMYKMKVGVTDISYVNHTNIIKENIPKAIRSSNSSTYFKYKTKGYPSANRQNGTSISPVIDEGLETPDFFGDAEDLSGTDIEDVDQLPSHTLPWAKWGDESYKNTKIIKEKIWQILYNIFLE